MMKATSAPPPMATNVHPAAEVRRGPVLSAAKFAAPHLPSAHVLRAELVAQVCGAPGGSVTLLRAATGFGKSTLLCACRERWRSAGVRVAWLNLDSSDNDAIRLLHGLNAAWTQAGTGDVTRPVRLEPAVNEADAAADLFERLAAPGQRSVIVLDDFEELQDPAAMAWIDALIRHLGDNTQLVIASRRMPDLSLSRLRAGGRLLELDADALRMNALHAEELVNTQRGLGLAADDLRALVANTEGWVAGLSLACSALERVEQRTAFIQGFSGGHSAVSEYLAECVLQRQSPPVRAFLLRTSIVRSFDAALCQALMPGIDARALLDELATTDIPLIALEGSHRSFRYHGMFAAFLRSVLESEAPEEVPLLHARAARWFESCDRPVAAIAHAIESGQADHAAALMRRHGGTLMEQGRMRLLERSLSALPQPTLLADPWLQAMHAWSTVYTQGAEAGWALLERYQLSQYDDAALQDFVRPLRPLILALLDRILDSAEQGQAALAQSPSQDGIAQTLLYSTVSIVLVLLGDFERGRALAEQVRRAQAHAASSFTVMHCETSEAIIDALQGRLQQAMGRLQLAVDAGRQERSPHSAGNAWAGVLHACVYYELGEIDRAEQLLRLHVTAIHALGLADMAILSYRHLARIAFIRGRTSDAMQTLSELEYLGHQRRLERVVACAKLERSHLLLLQGHVQEAREELGRAEATTPWDAVSRIRLLANETEDVAIGHLRWEALAGEPRRAATQLAAAAEQAARERRHPRMLRLRLLEVLALSRQPGERTATRHALEQLLHSTAGEGYVQMYLEEGACVKALLLLHGAAIAAVAPPAVALHVRRVCAACGLAQTVPPAPAPSQTLAEPLTRKEIRVLMLAAEGLADASIAEKLFVSLSTVRTHLRNAYAKLGVRSRMQAVLAARSCGAL